MSQVIKEEDLTNDGRWMVHPELGSVRTGPRGNRYWHIIGRSPDRGSLEPMSSGESELMAMFSGRQKNRRQVPDQGIGPLGTGESAYIDPRRALLLPKPVQRIKAEEDSEVGVSYIECSKSWQERSSRPDPHAALPSELMVQHNRSSTPPPSQSPPSPTTRTPTLAPSPTPTSSPEIFPIHGGQEDNPACDCPIHLECQVREGHLIDCRILVPIWKEWRDRQENNNPWDFAADYGEPEMFATPQQIQAIEPLLQRVADAVPATNAIRHLYACVGTWIHTMGNHSVREDDLHATNVILVLEQFLSDDNMPLRQAKRVPPEIQEDLLIILRKWQVGDFGVRPHRGFIRNDRGRWERDPDWHFGRSGKFFGHGHLVNGQRWVDRKTLWLDGAHAEWMAGIAGNAREGAYSVVMGLHRPTTKQVYADVDCREVIYYMSTALQPQQGELPTNVCDPDDEDVDVDPAEATRGAKALMKSHELKQVVRVFRSWKAHKKVPLRPDSGFRYDGLYKVVDYELLNNRRQIYRFKMVRERTGQGPIRGVKVDIEKKRKRDGQERVSGRSTRRKTNRA
ncbi:uncharacterized protein HMPREF1541_09178 [Cyphellophora europaea CBS 101466]|uniref:YDG domain-containing protein n=1 Tax=Cyphellophora europaea (strain CBS 101466) TaxID=1220924 RepID=W2S9J4_CYPE1|nr:uncharacterized protein HMPREF1541_09178 [Cyphellophora europaea CBS 101466]ETN45347.1 hypothetical protein HMPREF1541_09178 [Cyphellophora europaea CBS 101466]